MPGVTTARTASVTSLSWMGSGGNEKQETWIRSGDPLPTPQNDEIGFVLSWKGRASGSPGPLPARAETAGIWVCVAMGPSPTNKAQEIHRGDGWGT